MLLKSGRGCNARAICPRFGCRIFAKQTSALHDEVGRRPPQGVTFFAKVCKIPLWPECGFVRTTLIHMEEWETMNDTAKTAGNLTEEQLLAMPEGDYMNAEQLEFFRARLEAMRSELLENGQTTIVHLQETVAAPDEADRATQEEEHVLEQRIRDRERKLIHKIDSALDRIANGTYGFCEASGNPIGLRRLIARPTATLSIEEQERHEREEKLFR